jgi:hypothetical protein
MCEYCGCQQIASIGELTREHDAVVAEIAEVRSFLRDHDVEGAAKTARRIAEILGPHTAVEEGGLFPLMSEEFPDHVEALESEHRVVEAVLAEAAEDTPSDPSWPSRLLAALAETPELRNVSWYSCFSPVAKESLYSGQFKALLTGNAVNYMKDLFVNADARDLMDRTFSTDIHSYLPECLLVKMDIASMANSLEARSPFLDHKLMEFSASLPSSWKLHGLTSKYILRKTFDYLLPPEITKRGKMGFGIPVGKWFRGDWKGYYRDTVLSPLALSRGYFRKDTLERMYTEHTTGVRDHGYRMWALLILELWHREYLKDFTLP